MGSAWLSGLSFLAVSALIGVGLLVVAGLLRARPRGENPLKRRTYECGETPQGLAWMQFHARYYVVALFFVLFDVEAVFLFPWAVVRARARGGPAFVAGRSFVAGADARVGLRDQQGRTAMAVNATPSDDVLSRSLADRRAAYEGRALRRTSTRSTRRCSRCRASLSPSRRSTSSSRGARATRCGCSPWRRAAAASSSWPPPRAASTSTAWAPSCAPRRARPT